MKASKTGTRMRYYRISTKKSTKYIRVLCKRENTSSIVIRNISKEEEETFQGDCEE